MALAQLCLVRPMNTSEKLRFLLIRQFVYSAILTAMVAASFAGILGSLLACGIGIAFMRRLMPRWEKKLRETDVRLSRSQKHVYFGVGMIYFCVVFGALLVAAIRHSSPQAWCVAGLAFVVMFTLLYAAIDGIYGPNTKV